LKHQTTINLHFKKAIIHVSCQAVNTVSYVNNIRFLLFKSLLKMFKGPYFQLFQMKIILNIKSFQPGVENF